MANGCYFQLSSIIILWSDLELDCDQLFHLFNLVKHRGGRIKARHMNRRGIRVGLPSGRIRGNGSPLVSHLWRIHNRGNVGGQEVGDQLYSSIQIQVVGIRNRDFNHSVTLRVCDNVYEVRQVVNILTRYEPGCR